MDPVDVIRVLWRYKWYVLPALLVTGVAASYVFMLGPRTYESTASYALVNPKINLSTLDTDPTLRRLNSDNPYLRSSDPNLIANVVITLLNSQPIGDKMAEKGLGEYRVAPGFSSGGLIVTVAGEGETPAKSLATTAELGRLLAVSLRDVQKVNGADDRFLFTSILVSPPDRAVEQLSSRLRSLVVVLLGGVMLMFGAVSLGRWRDSVVERRSARLVDRPTSPRNRRRRAHRASTKAATEQALQGPVDGEPAGGTEGRDGAGAGRAPHPANR